MIIYGMKYHIDISHRVYYTHTYICIYISMKIKIKEKVMKRIY